MVQFKNIIIGVSVTIVLLFGLAASRLVKTEMKEEEYHLTKIEPISLTPPPVPDLQVEEQKVRELESLSPPPPAMTDLRPSIDVSTLSIPVTNSHARLDMEVDLFSEDRTPPNLPKVSVKQVTRKPSAVPVKASSRNKASLSLGDLDQKPRLLSLGRFRWPRGLRSNQVKAVVEVELSESGRVRLLRVKSLSDEAIRDSIPAIVNGSRYTAPKRNGVAVKLKFNWPLILQKP